MIVLFGGKVRDHALQAVRAGHQPQIATAFSRSPGRLDVHSSGLRLRVHSPADNTRPGTGGSRDGAVRGGHGLIMALGSDRPIPA
jgi:hypothetical protein